MKKVLYKYANVKNIILLFGLILVFNFIVFPITYKENTELKILDIQFSYSPRKAYNILGQYSKNERRNYLVSELTVDLIYPVIYSFMLCFIIFLLYKNERLAKLPFLILITDYTENLGVVTMIYNYPYKLVRVARITSIATSIKWFLVSLSIIVILYGLVTKIHLSVYKKTK